MPVDSKAMSMFTPFVPGLITLIIGMDVIIIMRRFLPDRKSPDEAFDATLEYTVELLVPSDIGIPLP